MNKLVLLVCLFLIPLTLASETQRRFKVYVNVLKAVADDDPHVGETLANHIKRELLSLEDVDLVRADQYWDFMLEIIYLQHKITDGRNTGGLSLTEGYYQRIPHYYFKPDRLRDMTFQPVYVHRLGLALYQRKDLKKYCVEVVDNTNKEFLTPLRELLR